MGSSAGIVRKICGYILLELSVFVRYYTPNREAIVFAKGVQARSLLRVAAVVNHHHIQLNHVSTDGEEGRKGPHPSEKC